MAEEQPKEDDTLNMRVYHTLKANKINNLGIITQEEYNRFVDALYAKPVPDYKQIPSIIRLPPILDSLAQALQITNNNFFLKPDVSHVRPGRKENFNQDLRIEEMKGLLNFMSSTNIAYTDANEKHQNFMLVGIDSKDPKRLNRVVFNKDMLGNYIVTIEKVYTHNLNNPHYKRVGAGLAPAIWIDFYSSQSPLTTFAPSPTPSGSPNNVSIPQTTKLSIDIVKNIGTVTAENFQEKLQYMCRLNKKETILVIASALTNMMTPNEAQKLDDLFKKELKAMPPSIDKTRQFTRLINGIAKGKVSLHKAQRKSKKHHHNHDDRGR